MRVAFVCATLWSGAAAQLMAHEAGSALPGSGHGLSSWDIAAAALLAMAGALYAIGLRRLARRNALPRPFERGAFGCGWVTLLIAVLPPLDGLSTQRFSAHMLQHELMMLVGAPLVIIGRPLPVWLWGIPAGWRIPAGELFRQSSVGGVWVALTAPLVAWILHGLAVWVWHIPALYDAAVADEGIHALQHAIFVGTSSLFWWGLLYGRYGRAGYGAAVFYVFTTLVHTGLLGAILTFGERPFYPIYLGPAHTGGLDPVADQQLAGLVMWIPAGIVLTLFGLGFFAAWIGAAEHRQRYVSRSLARVRYPPVGAWGRRASTTARTISQDGVPIATPARRRVRMRLITAGVILGVGLGGFADGIALHQIAQWHNMGSAILPPHTMEAMSQNMVWDGLFHLVTWCITLIGVFMLWAEHRSDAPAASGTHFVGQMLFGWGAFNLVEGVINHHVLNLHHVRDLPVHVPLYDWIFLAVGGFGFIALGLLLMTPARRLSRAA